VTFPVNFFDEVRRRAPVGRYDPSRLSFHPFSGWHQFGRQHELPRDVLYVMYNSMRFEWDAEKNRSNQRSTLASILKPHRAYSPIQV
jgi:hypothetical protein